MIHGRTFLNCARCVSAAAAAFMRENHRDIRSERHKVRFLVAMLHAMQKFLVRSHGLMPTYGGHNFSLWIRLYKQCGLTFKHHTIWRYVPSLLIFQVLETAVWDSQTVCLVAELVEKRNLTHSACWFWHLVVTKRHNLDQKVIRSNRMIWIFSLMRTTTKQQQLTRNPRKFKSSPLGSNNICHIGFWQRITQLRLLLRSPNSYFWNSQFIWSLKMCSMFM